GLLVSPSRGVLIFCPVLLLIAAGLVRFRRTLANHRLLLPAFLAVGGHFATLVCFDQWHGGCCYGPRYFTDVLPWFVLFSVLPIRGLQNVRMTTPVLSVVRETQPPDLTQSKMVRSILFICIAWSVWIHGRGAISHATWRWNFRMEREPQTAPFDWQKPQFLAQ